MVTVEELMSQLLSEHSRFVDAVLSQDQLAMSMVNRDIANSWQRCLNLHALNPAQRREPVLIAQQDLAARQEGLMPLLEVAHSEMENLYQQVAGSGYAILLTDTEGVILNCVGDPEFTETASRHGLCNGAVWTEQVQGTNGMGTCLVEQKALIIHQQEHFLSCHTGLTCSAAPIRAPDGAMLAVLDASAEARLAQQHTMVLVKMSAQIIENRLFLNAYKQHLLIRFHSRPEFVSTLGEGILTLTEDGCVLAANQSALFQLGIARDALLGRSIESVFTEKASQLVTLATRSGFHPVPIHGAADGRRFFGVVQLPQAANSGVARIHSPRWDNTDSTAAAFHLHPALARLDGGDPTMARNLRRAQKLVDRDIPLLLYGETGTGKSVFARALHDASARSARPFVAVNCASIPETLIESELFGYKAGAFTGANRRGARGKIAQADGGTLFLDEIGDMSLPLQARLLLVLEAKEVVPLGSETPESVDIAIVSATHRDLRQMVEKGSFREDLYYRLQGVSMNMPALRERHDMAALISDLARAEAPRPLSITPAAMRQLLQFDWPGNIRQLRSVLRTAAVLCDHGVVDSDDLPDEIRRDSAAVTRSVPPEVSAGPERNPLREAERIALVRELERTHWNVSKTARNLQLSRNTLYRCMQRHGIRPPR